MDGASKKRDQATKTKAILHAKLLFKNVLEFFLTDSK